MLKDWNTHATNDQQQLEAWAEQYPECNWAIACGPSGLVVVDIDPDGHEYYTQLDLEHGFPNTYTVKTPRGGYHYYFRGQTRNRVCLLPGIDIRSRGGYVLAPGSWVNNNPYTIEANHPIAPAPTWLLEMVGKPKEHDAQATEIESVDNLIDARRAAAYLSSVPPAIEGNGGDHHTYQVACAVRDLGISAELCLDLMSDLFNPRCEPTWSERELKTKITNAYKYAQSSLGQNSITNTTQAAQTFQFDEADSSFIPIYQVGLKNPPREWIAENWIPKGPTASTLLTGNGGTGKSLLALQLAVAVSTGTPFLGHETEQLPVLFLTCEDDIKELDRRVYHLRKQNPFIGLDVAPLALMPRAGKESILCLENGGAATKGKFYTAVESALTKFKPRDSHGLFIIDTVADVYAGNENIRSAVNGFIKHIIGGLCLKHNVTPLLIAHPSKGQGQTYAGSTAWNNSVRNRIFLQWSDKDSASGDQKIRVLSHEKSNYSGAASEIYLDWDQGQLIPIEREEVESIVDGAVLTAIMDAAKTKTPLSLTPQSPRYIFKAGKLLDSKGKQFRKSSTQASLDRLMKRGEIVEIKGQPRHNGLWPAETAPELQAQMGVGGS